MALGAKSGSVWLADNLNYAREANFGGVPLAAIARTPDDERPGTGCRSCGWTTSTTSPGSIS